MSDETFLKLEPLVRDFSLFIKEMLDNALKNGEVKEHEIEQEVIKWKLNDFGYSIVKGISCSGATSEQSIRKNKIFIHHIDEKIKLKEEYKIFIEKISKRIGFKNLEEMVLRFVKKFSSIYLRNKFMPEDLVTVFIKELEREPIKMWANVELVGLTLEPESIQINSEIKLRKPTKKDLEKEHTIFIFYNRDALSLEYPSAIIEIEIFGKSGTELQEYIEKSITMLRLFGAGGVKYIRYTLSSEGISSPIGGIVSPLDKSKSKESYIIYNKDVERLRKFWRELSIRLNFGFNQDQFSNNQPNLFFSYQRYSEAILSNDIIEKKIVNTISGLESLYLNSNQELSRYLRLNVSKVMGLFGHDAYKVREQIKDSYNIRSVFIHGDILDYRGKKKYIKKYASLENLFLYIVDYLRISLLLFLALKIEKDEFIDILEDILIDTDKEQIFQNKIISIKEMFGI